VLLSSLVFKVNLAVKPGGFLLGFILTLALTSWLWDVAQLRSVRATLSGLRTTACLALFYMAAYHAVDLVVSASVPTIELGMMHVVAMSDILVVFCALFAMHGLMATDHGREVLKPVYVHAANGFYIEAWTRRVLAIARR
jgi:biotin transporter BioY